MSRKKFDVLPMKMNWKDIIGCFSLCSGLFLATMTLNGNNDGDLDKQETVVSLAGKQLKNIIPQSIPRKNNIGFKGPTRPLIGPPPPADFSNQSQGPGLGGLLQQVFNKKYSVN